MRLWEGGELYYNPEPLQGYGVAISARRRRLPQRRGTTRLPPTRATARRAFTVRQTFGLGGEREKVESDLGQLAGERDISRITVQAGKFAVQDVFDNNTYANDARWRGLSSSRSKRRPAHVYRMTM